MNQKSIDPLSEVEGFLKSRALKNKRRKNGKNERPEVFVYTAGHVFRGDVLRITPEVIEIDKKEYYRHVFPNYVDQGVCYTAHHIVVSRKDIIAVGVNKKEWGEP